MIINEFNIYQRSLERFVNSLCSNNPIPGGGCVAAMAGVLGQGLVLMVSNFTTGKEKYSKVQPLVDEAIALGNSYLEKFKKLSMNDMQYYSDLTYAFRMSKYEPEDRESAKDVEECLQKCLEVPFEVIEECEKAMDLLYRIYDKFNMNLISDFGVACKMFESAAYSSYLNVMINEKSLTKDGSLPNTKKALEMCEKIKKQSDEVYDFVVKYMMK